MPGEKMMVCQEAMEAYPEETMSVMEQEKAPKEEVAVKLSEHRRSDTGAGI
jgi:hypothetical protein